MPRRRIRVARSSALRPMVASPARRCNSAATEGAVAATDWAFDNLGWTDVVHSIAPDNVASQSVARRLGSINRGRGVLPEPYQDSVIDVWGQTREQWRARAR